jgi:16S rRNA (cytidine1402-2'-O)-methyltransferase
MQKKPLLVLLPNVINDEETDLNTFFPQEMIQFVSSIDGLIAESEKGGRSYLKRFPFPEGKTFRDIPIKVLSEHTKDHELTDLMGYVKTGVWGLISDAGLPCLADPGARLVLLARKEGVDVRAHVGPSSIIMALMLSGLGAQKFSFEGYLPKDALDLTAKIKLLQQRAQKEGSTHVFIETPYRSIQLLEKLIATLDDKMKLSVSFDLTMPSQKVMTQTIKEWKRVAKIENQKPLCVFVLSS